MTDYNEIRDYLYGLKNQGSKYGIDRMRLFVEAIGYPQKRFPSIHIAGTNGKGSTCALIEALYRSNGYKTGFFNSPHLVHLGERVQVNRKILTQSEIAAYAAKLRPIAEELGKGDPENHPSFFELMVGMAFLRFAEAEVDIALLETGLGGRLDATNVVEPELSIITSISFDHTDLLGDTLEAIASEKAGIIKAGKPILIGKLPQEAESTIRRIAQERSAALYSITDRFPNEAELPKTNLTGGFQRWNAALAVYATELLGNKFPIQSLDALKKVEWAGRWQTIQLPERRIILDATHNPEGAEALKENLEALIQSTGKKPIIVAGTLGEDRAKSLMQTIVPYASELHLVEPKQPRATPIASLRKYLPHDSGMDIHKSKLKNIFPKANVCKIGEPGDTILVTGSLYLIGEALERLSSENPKELGSLQDLL